MNLRTRLNRIEHRMPPRVTCPHCGESFWTPDDDDTLLDPAQVLAEMRRAFGLHAATSRDEPPKEKT
jgi:hypothetical protein